MLSSSKKSQPIVYRTDFEKHVINSTCDRRGFVRYRSDTEEAHDEWNIYWASVHSVRCLFNPETGRRLHDGQLINHFPNHYELTRKDLMIKNIKRFRKEVEKRWQLSTLRRMRVWICYRVASPWCPFAQCPPRNRQVPRRRLGYHARPMFCRAALGSECRYGGR